METTATVRTARLLDALKQMPDPRHHNIHHNLIDILTIALLAVICGAEGWVDVVRYGRSKHEWLKSFLELPSGIPSHDTFGKVFARLNPDAFEICFRDWMAALVELSSEAGGKLKGALVSFDGKSLRRSFERGWDKCGMAHMVSAFVAANQMVFAQEKTDGKGKELDAVEKLLAVLDLEGAVVTIDALGCNTNIAGKIRQAKADYVLQVKENQPTLLAKMTVALEDARRDGFAGLCSDEFVETDKGHGQIETRRLWVCWDVETLLGEALAAQWPGLRCLIMVRRKRGVDGVVSEERAYYISSLDKRRTAKQLAGYVRGHWAIENNLHWQLDVSFREDERRIRTGHGAENFSRLCRMSLNQLKRETTAKVGIACKRKMCGWDNDYLLKVVLA
jgi:predicted transposase YbfD/YdcC